MPRQVQPNGIEKSSDLGIPGVVRTSVAIVFKNHKKRTIFAERFLRMSPVIRHSTDAVHFSPNSMSSIILRNVAGSKKSAGFGW